MIKYNLSGTWKTVKTVQANVSGTWKTVGQIYVNVSGTWKSIWSYSWSTGSWGSCSATCGNGTQTRTVTCKRNDGQSMADSLCTKYVGTKPSTSQSCNLGACEECGCSSTTCATVVGVGQSAGCLSGVPRSMWVYNGVAIINACGGPSPVPSVGNTYTKDGYIYYTKDPSCDYGYTLCRKPA